MNENLNTDRVPFSDDTDKNDNREDIHKWEGESLVVIKNKNKIKT